MRENTFYPGPHPPGLPRAPLSGPAPFPQFSPTPPRLQGYQRPQIQVKKTVCQVGKNRDLSFLIFSDKKSVKTGRCWPRRPSPCQGTSTPPRILTRASDSASCRCVSERDLHCENKNWLLSNFKAPGHQTPRFDMPPEETADLEELEEFSKMFKQKRIKLGKLCYTLNQFSVVACSIHHLLIFHFITIQATPRVTWVLRWGSSTATIFHKQQFPDSKLLIFHSRTCANSNLFLQNG